MVRQAETLVVVSCLACTVLIVTRLQNASTQSIPSQTVQDPLKQAAPSLELNNETILDGLGKLNQSTIGVGFAIEHPLGRTMSDKAPELRRFQVVLAPNTLANILDQLCELDPTFSWQQFGGEVNVFPRAIKNDKTYLFNRKLDDLELKDVSDAQAAVFQAVAELPPPKEQIAIMQTGAAINFARPWTVSFKDITIREAFDRIAQQIGSSYGWQFTGSNEFRLVIFYARLGTMPTSGAPSKPKGQ